MGIKSLKLPKIPKLPNFLHLPRLKLEPIRKFASFFVKHKILTIILISLIAFITAAIWYRGYLISKMNSAPKSLSNKIFDFVAPEKSEPTIALPSPSDTQNSVMGASDYSNYDDTIPTPFPTFAPLPTIAPALTTTTTITNTSSNSTGNSNCTTGAGVPNTWYSDVYPNPPISTSNGAVTMSVVIRDCYKNTAQVNDTLMISLVSGNSDTQINGNNLPYTLKAQNGQASFNVTSSTTGTVTLEVKDTTRPFVITNINNQNPTITFNSQSSGNSNCMTGPGVPNTWYSDVYPASPVTINTGSSTTFTIVIRDCSQNTISSNQTLTISQSSSDSSLTINGSAPPATIQAQNGQASFTVSSQNAGTDTLVVQNTTSSFRITDPNNNNPSVVFSGSSTTTPIPTPTSTSAPSSTPTLMPLQTATPAPPSQSDTLTPVPNGL